jgi:hypothetical protein
MCIFPYFLSFPWSHAFQNVGQWMIWDSNSSNMEELNVDEWDWTMGFWINTTIVLGISKGTCRQILGPIMDIDQLFMD